MGILEEEEEEEEAVSGTMEAIEEEEVYDSICIISGGIGERKRERKRERKKERKAEEGKLSTKGSFF